MFNFANVVQTIVRVAAAVTNVVNTVIQRATGGQGRLAEAAQSFTNAFNSFFGGGEGSSRRDDDDPSGQAARPSGPSPEELRRREQERKAQAFDDDIDRQRGRDELHEDGELEGVAPERRTDLHLDIAAFLQGEPTPAELLVAAAGNPVAQALLQMLRHERSHLDQIMQAAQTVEQGIVSLFGLAEEDTIETAEAARIYEQAKAYSTDDNLHLPLRLMTPEQIERLMASDAAWGGGPTYSKAGGYYQMRGSRPESILVSPIGQDQSSQPTAEGQKYLLAVEQVSSEVADIDPVFLGMIVKNEWDNRAYEQVIPFFLTQADPNYSYGVAQIQGATAVETIQRHPELFKDFPQIFGDNSNVNQDQVEWELFVNEELNLRVAAAHVGDLRDDVTGNLEEAGIVISDQPIEGQVTMTPAQVDQLTAITWNEGPDRVATLLNEAATSEEALQRMLVKIEAYSEPGAHLSNVYGQQAYVEEQVGQNLGVDE